MLHLPVPLLEAQVEDGLDAIPEITGDQGRMVAAVCPAVPLEVAGVEPAPEDAVDRGPRDRGLGSRKDEPFVARLSRDVLQGVEAGRVPLEETDVLLGKVDLDVEFVDRDPVTEVPVQTVGLLDKDGPAR